MGRPVEYAMGAIICVHNNATGFATCGESRR